MTLVQQGIRIDKEWLKNAGSSGRLHVLVQPGEIRIPPGPAAVERVGTALGWNVFRTLGDEATPGQLPDAAAAHDRYLYGKLNVEAAIQLYTEGQVTLGRAAEIAGITRWEFETLLADRGIVRSVSSDPADELERQWDSLAWLISSTGEGTVYDHTNCYVEQTPSPGDPIPARVSQ